MFSKHDLGFDNFKGFDALLMCVWTLPVFMYNLRGAVSRILGEIGETFFLPTVFAICVIASINYILKHIRFIDVLFYISCIGYFYFCYNYYDSSRFILHEIMGLVLVQTVPLFFVGLCINIEKSERMLFTLSVLCIILKALSIFLGGGVTQDGASGAEAESMSAAHNILPYILMVLWITFKSGGLLNWIITAFSILFILSLGNRGAVFGVLLFVVLYFIIFKKYKHPVRSRVLIALAGGFGYMLLKPIMLMLMTLFSSLGLSTRIFAKFIEDSITDDNGREAIYAFMKDKIEHGPFFGYGLAGDRANMGGLDDWSHNILIEMQMTFGKIPGLIIISLLLILLFFAFKKCIHINSSQFLLVLFCTCSILLFSSSFIQYPMFFMMLGYCIQCLRNKQYWQPKYKKYAYDTTS